MELMKSHFSGIFISSFFILTKLKHFLKISKTNDCADLLILIKGGDGRTQRGLVPFTASIPIIFAAKKP